MSSILEALGGAGAPAAPDLPPSIPDPEAGAAPVGSGPSSGTGAAPASEVQTLKDLLGLADTYKTIGTVTEQERAQMEKVTTILQTLLASNEKMSDQMTGATPALRKAFGAGG